MKRTRDEADLERCFLGADIFAYGEDDDDVPYEGRYIYFDCVLLRDLSEKHKKGNRYDAIVVDVLNEKLRLLKKGRTVGEFRIRYSVASVTELGDGSDDEVEEDSDEGEYEESSGSGKDGTDDTAP